MEPINNLPLAVISDLYRMLRWFQTAILTRGEPVISREMAACEPFRYGRTIEAVTAPGKVKVHRRVRNDADDDYCTTEEEEEVYTGGDTPRGTYLAIDTLVRYGWYQDPQFPHLVILNFTCVPEPELEEEE